MSVADAFSSLAPEYKGAMMATIMGFQPGMNGGGGPPGMPMMGQMGGMGMGMGGMGMGMGYGGMEMGYGGGGMEMGYGGQQFGGPGPAQMGMDPNGQFISSLGNEGRY